MNDLQVSKPVNGIGQSPQVVSNDLIRSMADFTKRLNQAPPADGIEKTPDGKASTLTISHVEGKLDEIYLRQWGTKDVNIQIVANEILVWLTLWVIDPSSGIKIERSGFAAVQITVDKVPDNLRGPERNQWALNLQNKKANACHLAFPKAKSMAIKNAAQSLGVIFGRNLNRKNEDLPEDVYTHEIDAEDAIREISTRFDECKTTDDLLAIWNEFPEMHANNLFKKHFTATRQKLNLKKQ